RSGMILAMGSLLPSAADSFLKPARQFGNSIRLSAPDRLPRDQLSAYAKRNCTRQNEVERSRLIHASSCNQWHAWEHDLQGTNVAVATDVPARNNLHKIGAQFPGSNDIGRGKCSRDDDDILFHGKRHGLGIKPVTGQEVRSGIQTTARCFCIQHTARTDNHFLCTLHHMRDYFGRLGYGQGNFYYRDATARDRFSREQRIISRRHTNGRNDADFLDSASHLLLVHGPAPSAINSRLAAWFKLQRPSEYKLWQNSHPDRFSKLLQSQQVRSKSLSVGKLSSSIAALSVQKVEQACSATPVRIFADVAVLLRNFEVAGAIELDHAVVLPQPFIGIVHIRHHLSARGFFLFLRLWDGKACARNLALVAIENRKRNAAVECRGVDAVDVGVVGLDGDVLLANRPLQIILASCCGHPFSRRTIVGAILHGFELQVFTIAPHRLIVERPCYVIVRRNGFVSQQLPEVRKRLNLGELRLLKVGLELQQ